MPKTKRPQAFSVTKTVKAHARACVGTPPPSTPIEDRKAKAMHGPPKHKRSLAQVLQMAHEER